MSFVEWFLGKINNPTINNQWGPLHITVLVSCIVATILIGCIFGKTSRRTRKIVLYTLVSFLILFEVTRRVKNLINMTEFTWNDFMYIMLPRPWCAISSFSIIFSTFSKSTNYKNFACIISLLCALVFFAYPEAGFNSTYITFEQLYSICTHSLLLIVSISLMTLKFTKFDYKTIWKELIFFGLVYLYAFAEIYILDIATDPLYFMPNNDVQDVLGMNFGLYMITYVVFIAIFISSFYAITYLCNKKRIATEFATIQA